MAVFQHCSVLFELKGLSFKEKNKIKFAVTDNGGNMSFVPNQQCSLVVTSGVSSLSPSRLRNIVKHQIPVVGLDYVHRCLEANSRLPVEDFVLDISSSAPPVVNKDELSTNTSKTPKDWDKPLQLVNMSPREGSPKGRESDIKKTWQNMTKKHGMEQSIHRVYKETDHDLPKFPENFQVAKYSIFHKPNTNSWCVLELQSAKSESLRQYRVVKYWKDNIQLKRAAVRDQMLFVSTSEEAVKVYQDLVDSMKADGLKQQKDVPPQEMGSAPFQQLLLEEKLNTGKLSPEVGVFVELLWQEALGCIDLILTVPLQKISLNDVTRAEGLLLQVQRKLTEHKMEEVHTLWSEYQTLLPQRIPVSPDMSSVSKQFDLCQLIRDILNISEMSLGSSVPSSVGKYRALRCGIERVPPESSEFEAVTCLLQNSKIQIHQILRVNRAPELQNFKNEFGNIKPLLHSSSPHNFVGILSRGLLLPNFAVDQHGIQRTDAGNLGSGIYFSDDIKTSLKYSQCSSTDGSRLMLVCDVALGRCKDLLRKDLTLTQAPGGHDSVHGVKDKPGLQSEFTDDEYVVYSADQVKLKYVVQLSTEGDELKNFTPDIVMSEELPSSNQGVDAGEDGLDDIKNPLENVTAGLLNSFGKQIPLQEVHVKCKLMDLLAQVIIFQKYTNESSVPIEAKYVFPLDDSAAVSGFEAFINGKHVVGQVKEKESARREYKQAIEKGHGAYLMDQDAPDVFTISVGNLPPGATVLIKVTFVSELIVKDGGIFFSLPSSVAPWQENAALNQTTQVTVEKVCVTDEEAHTRLFNLDMSIEMPHEITEVKCITHKVKMKKTDCKAVVSVLPGEVMGPEGFQLLVTLTEVHVPRMWVEKHPSKDSQACMLVFYPKFDAPSCTTSDEVVLLLDASQSMKGESLNTARMLALQILKTLDQNVRLNVIVFGTDHTESFLSAKPMVEARQEAKNFIHKHFSSARGSTELWRPLRDLSLLPPSSGTRNLLLLSDGHIQNPELTLQLIRENATHSRLFTCGLSPTANRHMLRALAQAGGGAYEFFDPKSKHTWSEKVASQVKRMLAPGAKSVSVKWQQFNPTAPPPVQAPKQLHALFNDCHTLVFGFVPHCTQATLLGDLSGEEIKTMVSTSELQKTKGTFLHKLTARAIIRDFEDGSLDSNAVLHEEKKAELKSFIVELSKEFSILSQFTSFVAIEERDSEEERGFTDIPKVISEEDVDILPYICWAEEEEIITNIEEQMYDDLGDFSYEESYADLAASRESDTSDDFGASRESDTSDDFGAYIEKGRKIKALFKRETLKSLSFDEVEMETDILQPTNTTLEGGFEEDDDDYEQISPDAMPPLPVLVQGASPITPQNFDIPELSTLGMANIYMGSSGRFAVDRSAPPPPLPVSLYAYGDIQEHATTFVGLAKSKRRKSSIELPPTSPDCLQSSISTLMGGEPRTPLAFDSACTSAHFGGAPNFNSLFASPPPPPPVSKSSIGSFYASPPPPPPPPPPFARRISHYTLSSALSEPKSGEGAPIALDKERSSFAIKQPPPPQPKFLKQSRRSFFNAPVFSSPGTASGRRAPVPLRVCRSSPPLPPPEPSAFGIHTLLSSDQLPPPPSPLESSNSISAIIPHRIKYRQMELAKQKSEEAAIIPLDGISSTDTGLPPPSPSEATLKKTCYRRSYRCKAMPKPFLDVNNSTCTGYLSGISKWQRIFTLQHLEGYWELTSVLGKLLNCDISRFADDFLKRKGIASLGFKAHADILKLLATLLVLQLMRLENTKEGQMLRTLFCLEDTVCRPDHWEAVNRAVKWVCWADRQYPCVYSRLEFGLSWDSSTKQLLGAEKINLCSPLTGLNLNPNPYRGPIMQC